MVLKKLEKVFQIIVNTFLVIASIAIVFCVSGFFQLKVLKRPYVDIFGYTVFSVATGSMQPTLEINDIIIVKITDDIKVGDIITFKQDNDFITHRVISNNKDTFVTKGDYNNTSDNPIDLDKVVGKLVCKIPSVGVVGNVLLTPKVFISVLITLFFFSLCFSYVPNEKTALSTEKKRFNFIKGKNKLIFNFKENRDLLKDENKKSFNVDETCELFLGFNEVKEKQTKLAQRYKTKRLGSTNIISKKVNANSKTLKEEVKESVKRIEKILEERDKVNQKKKIDLEKTSELYINKKDEIKVIDKETKENLKKIEKVLDEKVKLSKKKQVDLDKTCELYLNIEGKSNSK